MTVYRENRSEDNGQGAASEVNAASRVGGQFLASLNHEIRTPLSGILGMVDLLFETSLDEEQQEYVSTVRLCADQLLEMLNSALEYSALSSGGVKIDASEFHLAEALQSVIAEFVPKAEGKGLRMVCRFDGRSPEYVVGDAVRLRQALSPLLANAVKFTPEGEIEVTTATTPVANGGVRLTVSVRDTGIGIPEEHLERIFESFHQLESGLSRTYSGMGLGLAVARKLAQLMDGNITVTSKPGAGSTFRLSLTMALPGQQADLAPKAAGQESGPARTRGHILLVDDNDVACRVVRHLLTRANYSIDCAMDGGQGIEAARGGRYDLILMDLQMPNINGLQATEAIRKLPGYRDTPILALTAIYSEDFVRSCQQAGLQDFLAKPIQRDALLRAIEKHLQ